MSNNTIRAVIITCFIIIVLCLIGLAILSVVDASGLSDETIEIVNDLRWKHYGLGTLFASDTTDWDFVYDWTTISFDDELGILYVETNNGTWFVEMQRKEE